MTALYQCYYIAMGGIPIAAIGYDATDAVDRYKHEYPISGLSAFKQILHNVESETSIPVALAMLETEDSLNPTFLCCYVDCRRKVHSCDDLMAVAVPPQFTRVKEMLGIDGDLKRVFSPRAVVFSYHVDGRRRNSELIGSSNT
jgi:hypothetical protein